jgi:hypothetical protein
LGNPLFNLPRERRDRFEHNTALAVRHYMKTREPVVPLKPEYSGAGWIGAPLEHFEGVYKIRQQFEQHIHQDPIPGVGRNILLGAILPDGSVFGPTPAQLPAPVEQIDPQPSVTSRHVAQPRKRIRLSPKKRAAAIAKAKRVIAKGADRAVVIDHLEKKFGIYDSGI